MIQRNLQGQNSMLVQNRTRNGFALSCHTCCIGYWLIWMLTWSVGRLTSPEIVDNIKLLTYILFPFVWPLWIYVGNSRRISTTNILICFDLSYYYNRALENFDLRIFCTA